MVPRSFFGSIHSILVRALVPGATIASTSPVSVASLHPVKAEANKRIASKFFISGDLVVVEGCLLVRDLMHLLVFDKVFMNVVQDSIYKMAALRGTVFLSKI